MRWKSKLLCSVEHFITACKREPQKEHERMKNRKKERRWNRDDGRGGYPPSSAFVDTHLVGYHPFLHLCPRFSVLLHSSLSYYRCGDHHKKWVLFIGIIYDVFHFNSDSFTGRVFFVETQTHPTTSYTCLISQWSQI